MLFKSFAKKIFGIVKYTLKKTAPPHVYWYWHSALLDIGNKVFGFTYTLDDLDRKMVRYLKVNRKGVFFEVGAVDGLSQSNTLFLERKHGWKGILVEPIPFSFSRCIKYRKDSACYNYILTSFERSGTEIEITEGDVWSIVTDTHASTLLPDQGRNLGAIKRAIIGGGTIHCIPSTTVTEILEKEGISRVDFFSLDVEGNELDVIEGIDFEKIYIHYLLVESEDIETLYKRIEKHFEYVDALSHHDYLFRNRREEYV